MTAKNGLTAEELAEIDARLDRLEEMAGRILERLRARARASREGQVK